MFSSKKTKNKTPDDNQYYCLIKSTDYPHTDSQGEIIVTSHVLQGLKDSLVTYFKSQQDLIACIEALQKLNGVNAPQPSDSTLLRKMQIYIIACIEIDPLRITAKEISAIKADLKKESEQKVSQFKLREKMYSLEINNELNHKILQLRKMKKSYFSLLPEEVIRLLLAQIKPIKVISVNIITGQKLVELDKNKISPLLNAPDKKPTQK